MTEPQTTFTSDAVFEKLREILCDILVLRPEDVRRDSKLVDDLDADSIAFLELTFRLRSDFGLQVPQAKVDEETLTLPLLEGLKRMEEVVGGTTLFEFMQGEAAHLPGDDAFSLLGKYSATEESRAEAARMSIAALSEKIGTPVPRAMLPDAPVGSLMLRDLFRFITVDSYVRYVVSLHASQERIKAFGGAEAMNAEIAAKLRAQP